MVSTLNTAPRRRLTNRRGAMMVFVAIAVVGLLGMLTLTLDIGAGGRQRRIAQTAADAGAIGGGTQIFRGMDSVTVVAAATSSATLNGFSSSNVTVSYPPATGTFVGNRNYVEVVIAKNIPTIFGSIFGKSSIDIRARGVAGLGSISSYCVFGLAASGNGIDIVGDLTTTCGVVSNASIYVKKGIAGDPTPTVAAVGSVDGGPSGNTFTGIPPVPDPYSYLQVPAETSCNFTTVRVTSTTTLNPGVYCGTATTPAIKVDMNKRAILNPGTYILRGGGLDAGEIEAIGVTIINTNGPGNNQSAYKPITFGNSCSLKISAPTSGPYKGIAIFQDPAAPASSNMDEYVNRVCGQGGEPDIEGVLYFPTQSFSLDNSNGKLNVKGTLVARYITGQNGGGKYTFTFDNTGNSAPKRLSLVQ